MGHDYSKSTCRCAEAVRMETRARMAEASERVQSRLAEGFCHERDALRAALAKAEAERDEARALCKHLTLACSDIEAQRDALIEGLDAARKERDGMAEALRKARAWSRRWKALAKDYFLHMGEVLAIVEAAGKRCGQLEAELADTHQQLDRVREALADMRVRVAERGNQ